VGDLAEMVGGIVGPGPELASAWRPRAASPSVGSGGVPFLSVIVTSHRRRSFVRDALESLRRQTCDAGLFEVVLTRAPQEGDEELLGGRAPPISSVTIDAPNYGEELAAGIRASRGRVICLLDDDDMFAPNKLVVVADAFGSDPRLGYFSNSFVVVDQEGRPVPDSPFRRRSRRARDRVGALYVSGAEALTRLAAYPPLAPDFNHSCLSIRRDVVVPVLETLREVRLSADTFLFYAALRSGTGIRIGPEPLTYYRLHDANVSTARRGTDGEILERLARHGASAFDSYQAIRPLADQGPRELKRAIEELLRIQQVYLALRAPSPERRSMVRALVGAFRHRERYVWRTERAILPLAGAFVLLPRAAQWAYLRLRSQGEAG
jgi:hypothetical protein